MTNDNAASYGPLHGLRVVEIAGLGPAPFAAMMLADAGAQVLRVSRPGQTTGDAGILGRGRTGSITVDLKDPRGHDTAAEYIDHADVLIEGFRPGVMERLDLGPETCMARNPGLIYARVTGYGRTGPLAATAGHDINYLALTGALRSIARRGEAPVPPLNLLGDYGGGGLLLVTGILAALLERHHSNRGQIVDAAMIDGASLLMTGVWNRVATGAWSAEPGANSIDGGSHFYNVYRTADDEFMAVGSIEPVFYRRLLEGLGLDAASLPDQHDQQAWPDLKQLFTDIFATRTRAAWTTVFANLDACVSPVLAIGEVADDPHIQAHGTLIVREQTEPAPAPRYGRTPTAVSHHDGERAVEPAALLRQWTSQPGNGHTHPASAVPVVSARTIDDATTLAANIGFTEGPVWTPEGRLFVTSLSRGAIYEVFLDGRLPVPVADPGAGPNGMTLGYDRRLWITQNGGAAMPSRSQRRPPPSIQVWDPRGHSDPQTIPCEGIVAPSDCAFGPDGSLWFTDPHGHAFGNDALPGRVWRFEPATGSAVPMLDQVYFPNGIAFGIESRQMYVAETACDRVRRYLVSADGVSVDASIPDLAVPTPDGIAVDADGGLWVAGSRSGMVSRFDSAGRMTQRIDLGGPTMPTSVCFAGHDLATLVVTVAKGGRVLAFDVDTPGLAVPSAAMGLFSSSTQGQEAR